MWPTCTVGKQGSASWRSRTRQHKVSPVRIPQSQRRLRYSFLWPTKRSPSPFVTEPSVVPRSGMPRRMPLRTFRPTGRWPIFIFFTFPLFYSPRTCSPVFHSGSPVIFSAKFDCRLSGLSSTACACRRKIFLPDTSASVFSASSLPGPATNPLGRKIISLRYRNVSEGKQKINLKI